MNGCLIALVIPFVVVFILFWMISPWLGLAWIAFLFFCVLMGALG